MEEEVQLRKFVKNSCKSLNKGFNWKVQIQRAKRPGPCGPVIGSSGFPKIAQDIYTTMIRPALLYGCVARWHQEATEGNI